MQFRVLGAVEADLGDGPVPLGGSKPRAVLGMLLVGRGRTVSVDRLIDELWPGSAPAQAMAALQVGVVKLRRSLEPGRSARSVATVLVTRPNGYAVDVPAENVDAERFVAAAGEAHAVLATDPARAAALLDEAIGRWRGEAYEGLTELSATLATESARLAELRLTAQEDRWAASIALGDYARAISELEPFVAAHPLRETGWAALATALYRAQRQADALDAVGRARAVLADELGLDLGPTLRELQDAMLRQDPALNVPAVPRPAPPERPVVPGAEPAAAPAQAPPPDRIPDASAEATIDRLVGRAGELAEIDRVVREVVATGRGRIVLISGDPGIGKSRLLEAVTATAAAQGLRVGVGRCEEDGGTPPLWPWTQAVRAVLAPGRVRVTAADLPDCAGAVGADPGDPAGLGPLLPELGYAAPQGRDADSTTFALADAVVTAIAAIGPTLLALDDIHWADGDSVRLLRRVAGQLERCPGVLVLAVRGTEADINPDAMEALAAIARLRPVRIRLDGLDAEGVAAAIAGRHGQQVRPDVAHSIRLRTDGNPFYVGELADLLVSEGLLHDAAAPARLDVPDGVRDVVRRRLDRLPTQARQFLAVAAVVGRSFDADLVQDAAGLPDDDADIALEAAELTGLVMTDGAGGHRFAHALVRDTVLSRIPPARRARAHADVARALLRRSPAADEPVGDLAFHFAAAGRSHRRIAWRYADLAAQRALAQPAHAEAERLWQAAVDLQSGDAEATAEERAELLVRLGAVRRLTGRDPEGWQAVRDAARISLAAGNPVAAARAVTIMITGAVWTWRDYGEVDDEAIALLERVLAELPADQTLLRAAVTCVLATELQHDAAQVQRAIRLSTEATPVIRELGSPDLQFHALVGHHRMLWVRELLDQRVAITEELLEMADRSGDLGDQAIAHVLRGSNRLELCDVDGGLADVRRAVELAQQAGIVPIRVIVGWAAATVPYLHGDFAAAARAVDEVEALHSSITLVGGAHLSSLHRSMHMLMRGRLPDVAPQLKAVVDLSGGRLSSWSEFYGLALAQAGRLDQVRAFLGPWGERPPVPEDYVWTIATINRAELYTLLGDQEAIASIRAELAPYRERLAYGGTGVTCQGLVREALGWLAACAGDLAEGVRDLADSREWYARHGFRAFGVRATGRLAVALAARGGPEDATRAALLTVETERAAAELGIDPRGWLVRWVPPTADLSVPG